MRAEKLHALAQAKLADANVTLDLGPYDQKVLAKTPAAIFVCNQLLPGIDEWILIHLLALQAEAVKVLHPYPIPPPYSLRSLVLLPQRNKLEDRFLRLNFAKKAAKYVQKGVAVGLALDFSDNLLGNMGKNLMRTQILKQLRKTGAAIVPIHLSADGLPNSPFRKALFDASALRFAEPVRVNVRIGNAIQPADLALFHRNRSWGKFLQAKIFSLGSPFDFRPEHFTSTKPDQLQPLAHPVDPALVSADIAALKPGHYITSRGQFDVLIAPFIELPHAMLEIARLRELTFRTAGEGSGQSRDMDEYDLYYLQLIIWDREAQRIAGGYRLGQGDRIFRRFGVNGFYTSSLFKMKAKFFPILQQAIELGRSYIVPDYQKHRLPLFLLWKGILHFLLANPQYRYLYGPVSISKEFSDISKSVIVEFIKRFCFDREMAKFVRPRKPFRIKIKSVNTRLLAEMLHGEFDALESFVEAIEPEHFKVPVLFRQYLKQNARFISFNVDPNFSDCLDGLMVLDLRNLPASTIEALQQEK
ncbi:MAG: lysophospholipid acyltransferase family protein [Saprospirales bacterium]|jgi:putative hemolysin|nr:lysophospholipid acyltransferase family protein [Saprospirales bacterium]MBK8921022.1 lysophospholipid acyltransferase family protein [Saprospirales bacterium]